MTRDGIELVRPTALDALGLAVGTALVAGALSVVASFLAALVGTLAALAVLSWTILRGRSGVGRRAYVGGGRAVPLGVLAAGTVVFLSPPLDLFPYRGLLLALSLVPLWARERGWPRLAPRREADA